MVDEKPDFSSRLDAALAMHGLDNAAFAKKLGVHGQQHIHQWRTRGRIGGPSIPKVRAILERTDMEWLLYGIGEPHRTVLNTEYGEINSRSYVARLDPRILAKALKVLNSDEFVNGTRQPLSAAIYLLQTCDRLSAGEAEADLIEAIYSDKKGNANARANEGVG